ncbi:MAG TPA: bifunctional rhamnulose-1-phosphate aldolase/short-chain dehydrogenase [Arenibaculum sp.]|nr:bifunctional rhamnulose-1-phosphate aldolase/short-chain dehydrogenase [Arenibaculum sp.]
MIRIPACANDLVFPAAHEACRRHGSAQRVDVDKRVAFRIERNVDPDAIIAIAASKDSKALTAEIFGDDIGWLPWKRPGYELGLWLERFCLENPGAKGVVLESHGLFTWADDARECYETMLRVINRAIAFFDERAANVPAFGGERHETLPKAERRRVAAALMPAVRGMISKDVHKVGHFDDQDAVLEFVDARDMEALASLGTSCPDHFLRTKIRPLVVDFDPAAPDIDATLNGLRTSVEQYRADYAAYYGRCKRDDSPAMRDPNAVVYLVPGVGMITFARDKATARISGEFYVNAINVMRGAFAVSEYRGLPEQEAFDIEYWQLEEAKLRRMPKSRSLAGRIAIVTGGAGGIGSATAERYLREGACIVLADIDAEALDATMENLAGRHGRDVVRTVRMDVTSEDAVAAAYADMAVEFGGVDIVVSNAGIASSAPVEETTLDLWNRNMSILSTGAIDPYRLFLVFNELVDAAGMPGFDPAHMLDQSHNVTDPIESLMVSAMEVQRAYAQALLVDKALGVFQEENDALMATNTLKRAFRTDVEPILAMARRDKGAAVDPVAVYRASGYRAKVAQERPAIKPGGGGIV